jgi:NAD+ synthase (glutamine-hydrolysing)
MAAATAPLRLALCQVNPTVGALADNAALVEEWARRAAAEGADLIVFPEMVLTGYPIEDLALRPSFQQASLDALTTLATALVDVSVPVVVGYLDRADPDPAAPTALGRPRGGPVNAAAVIQGGRITHRYAKHHLPNYGVFDEFRYFVPGTTPTTFPLGDRRIALAICEDLWRDGGPVQWARDASADLLVVINGSPYERNKDDVRLALCQRRAREAGCTLAYVNLVGAQDELVFDGDSLVVDAESRVLGRAPQFDEALLLVDVTAAPAPTAVRLDDAAEVYAALTVGVRDYIRKNGFTSVLLGLSGGIDSALTAAIACDALGADHVFGISMPSAHSSEHSREDATDLARRTGLHLRTVPIESMVSAFAEHLDTSGIAGENLQARVRGMILMTASNAEGHLVLATGNKSELSVGYSTMYGDAVGAFAPIKDVPKSLVWELARWRNAEAARHGDEGPIPERSITKPPSAELRPGQFDTDSLPEYNDLDAVLDLYVEQDLGVTAITAAGFAPDLVNRVVRLTDTAEYKRRQYPPGPKISGRAFGRDRRLPVTNHWREGLD